MRNQSVGSYIPFFGRDFLTATMGWTAEERGHYIVLLITQWEQGSIPATADRIELISPGISQSWGTVEPKFPLCDDGLRRNARLEEHREKAQALKRARSEAGAKGNATRWAGSQSDRKAIPNGIASSVAKVSPPSPSPSPSPIKKEKDSTLTLIFPCDGGSWSPTEEMVKEWSETYPHVDIVSQLRRARQWCIDNESKRKTPRGMRRFIGTWLANVREATGERKVKELAEL